MSIVVYLHDAADDDTYAKIRLVLVRYISLHGQRRLPSLLKTLQIRKGNQSAVVWVFIRWRTRRLSQFVQLYAPEIIVAFHDFYGRSR